MLYRPSGARRRRPLPHTVCITVALKVGAVVWLASELMFFSGLFAAYYFLPTPKPGRNQDESPNDGEDDQHDEHTQALLVPNR